MLHQSKKFGLILAAGRGRRMGKDSQLPKCLSKVKGKALIDIQISAMRAVNVSSIVVLTGYKRHLVAPFGDLEVFNDDWEQTNMVYSLLKAGPVVNQSGCVVSYGDIFYEESALKTLMDCPNDISILYSDKWIELWKMRSDDPLNDAETLKYGSEGQIIELGKKPKSINQIKGQYTGLFKISYHKIKEFIYFYDQLNRSLLYDGRSFKQMYMTSFLQLLIESGWMIMPAKVNNGWLEVDTVKDIQLYERLSVEGKLDYLWKKDN